VPKSEDINIASVSLHAAWHPCDTFLLSPLLLLPDDIGGIGQREGINIASASLHAAVRYVPAVSALASTMSSPAPYEQWKLSGMRRGCLKCACLTIIQGLCIDNVKKGKKYYADIVVIDRSQRETIAERLRIFPSAEKKEHDSVRS
jgi:hypothetical protein